MTLPTPRLDDRTFQDLVDEAKRTLQARCPSWTNHNVSDPGVTLIETFAWMTDILLYRLNRVPDALHVAFLELMGERLFPPAAARTVLSFRLSAHHDETVRIPAGTAVSTARSLDEDPVVFTTTRPLEIPPATSRAVMTVGAAGRVEDLTGRLGIGTSFPIFADEPRPDDALYLALDRTAPSTILLVQAVCVVGHGHGVELSRPPVRWEAWTPSGWERCAVDVDSTGGFNMSGAIEIHLPARHAESVVHGVPGAWVRCRVDGTSSQTPYRTSPRILSVTAATVGGDVESVNARPIHDEVLGTSDGTPGQSFRVAYPPVVLDGGRPPALEVGLPGDQHDAPATWEEWTVVDDFTGSTPTSLHAVIDAASGELRFGPAVRQEDGVIRAFGAVPPRGSLLRLRTYRTGGGARGNVAAGALSVLRSSIPYVAGVTNHRPAIGGVDGETVAEARLRGPLSLRSRARAVTAEDYVTIVRAAAPELARVHCVAGDAGAAPGSVRVLAIPGIGDGRSRVSLGDLQLPEDARERVLRALDETRVVGVRVSVEPPSYVGIRVDARLRARPDVEPARLESDAVEALHRYFSPLTGGPSADGWPLGRPVQPGEAHAVLARLPGVDFVEEVVLFRADPVKRTVSAPQDRIVLAPTHVVLSVEHSVVVESETR